MIGIFVPPGDARALRQAIEYLWNPPGECERMGREGRDKIERFHTLDAFVDGVQRAVVEAIEEARGGESPRATTMRT